MKNLILYGSQNLSNKKCGVEDISNFRGNLNTIQKIRNSRFAGSTVVEKKVEEKSIVLRGVLRSTPDKTLEEILNEYSGGLSKEDRYLRLSTNYHVFTTLADRTGWQVMGDTTSLDFDTEEFQYGDGSIVFNNDVSEANTYCGVYTNVAEETDLSAYGNSGSFEAWVYLPTSVGVESIEIRVGNDASNYYSGGVTQQYDGTPFEMGWNYISILVESMDITGTIDPYSIGEYLYTAINYNDLMTDNDDFRVGGILWQDEDNTRNFKAYVEDFRVSMGHSDINRASFDMAVMAYEGVAESTGDYVVLGTYGQTVATYTDSVDLEGTYTPLPRFIIDVKAATNVSKITFSNVSTGDSVAIERTFSAGERVVIDTSNKEVTVNGVAVDYDDVLPRFMIGKNYIRVAISTTSLETVDELVQNTNLTGEA